MNRQIRGRLVTVRGDLVPLWFLPSGEERPSRGWMASRSFPQQLLQTFPDIDPNVRELFLYAEDIKQWRLFIHQEYPY